MGSGSRAAGRADQPAHTHAVQKFPFPENLTADASRRRGPVARILRAPFTRRTWRELGYALAGLPIAVAGFAITVTLLSTGIMWAVGFFGVPVLAMGSIVARWLGVTNRTMARRLLGLQIGEPAPLVPRPGFFGWILSQLTDIVAWRARAYALLKFPVAIATFVVAVTTWIVGIDYTLAPLAWVLGLNRVIIRQEGRPVHFGVDYGSLRLDTMPGMWLLCIQGIVLLLAAPWAVRAMLNLDRRLIYGLLGPVSLSERVHDLERTRKQAVDDSAARLRSIERDLHDGAQAQLVAVAMKLGLAKEKLGGGEDPAAELDVERALELVDTAHRTAREAINELRDLARGIHPPALDRGLEPALSTLAARSAVPVDLVVDIPQRPSAAIETIAYFCAAELLANVAKHSGARHAALEAVHVPGLIRVRVSDDGHGGATVSVGSGLRGLADRVRTVDGRLDIASPPGGPTVVTAELPTDA
ncbi:MAG TPA: sensor domain-containing protein [Streptosporangiaceae bacterium]